MSIYNKLVSYFIFFIICQLFVYNINSYSFLCHFYSFFLINLYHFLYFIIICQLLVYHIIITPFMSFTHFSANLYHFPLIYFYFSTFYISCRYYSLSCHFPTKIVSIFPYLKIILQLFIYLVIVTPTDIIILHFYVIFQQISTNQIITTTFSTRYEK